MEREVRRHYEKVIWEIIMPKKNPQDLTLRNLRALKKRVDKIEKVIKKNLVLGYLIDAR